MADEAEPDEPMHVVCGVVVQGDQRGRTLGFPTANIRLDSNEDAPPFGVYAARVLGRAAAVSIGVRPTYGSGLEPLAEVHVLDFAEDLYGQELDVELFEQLRPEVAFASSDELVRQIEADIAAIRAWQRAHPDLVAGAPPPSATSPFSGAG